MYVVRMYNPKRHYFACNLMRRRACVITSVCRQWMIKVRGCSKLNFDPWSVLANRPAWLWGAKIHHSLSISIVHYVPNHLFPS